MFKNTIVRLSVILIISITINCSSENNDPGGGIIDNEYQKYAITHSHMINKDIVNDNYPTFSYGNLIDAYMTRLTDSILPNTVTEKDIQVFILDSEKKSIYYYIDESNMYIYSDATNLENPKAIAVTNEGDIYISDLNKESVLKYKFNNDTFIYDKIIINNVQAIDIAVDKDNNIYLLEQSSNSIQKYDNSGNPVNSYIDPNTKTSTNKISSYIHDVNGTNVLHKIYNVRGIDLDSDNNIYLIEDYGRRLVVFDKSGIPKNVKYISQDVSTNDVAVSNKSIYLISKISNKIIILSREDKSLKLIIEPLEYPDPLGKIQNMKSIACYPPYGLMFVLDEKGGGVFIENDMLEKLK